MSDKKTLQVCSYYMGTKLYQNLFDEFERKGIGYDILYFCAKSTVLPPVNENVIVSQAYNPFDRFIFPLKHAKVYKNMLTKIDTNDYFMTHAHSLISNGYISNRLKHEYSLPYIVAVRNTDVFTFLKYKPYLIFLARKIMNEAENVIFISPRYRDLVLKKFVAPSDYDSMAQKSVVLPNGIDNYYLENLYHAKESPKYEISLIYVGRVDDFNKNIFTTIKACDLLISKGQKVKLNLIGRLNNKFFKKLIPKRDYINYLGQQDKKNVLKYLRESDIFVMPSKHETFGLVYVEAMSQGLPVIYTKEQGFDGNFEEGEVGYHVVYNNPIEIAKRIMDIKADYSNISKNAIEGSKRFNWDNISDEYIELYTNIMNMR